VGCDAGQHAGRRQQLGGFCACGVLQWQQQTRVRRHQLQVGVVMRPCAVLEVVDGVAAAVQRI
jgi:hypothetical protein